MSLYGATKAFNMVFSENLHLELRDKIDVLVANPSMVLTPILLTKMNDPKALEKAQIYMI